MHFVKNLNITSQKSDSGVELRFANLNGNEIIVAVFGVGSVSAAAATQLLISRYNCGAILNAGAAGGIASPVTIGDLVLCDFVAYHDFDAEVIKNYPPYSRSFSSNAALLGEAADYCTKNNIACAVGGVATGNAFVCNAADAKEISARTGCLCVDMECAGIAQTAGRSDIPMLAIKVITDLANEDVASLKNIKDMPYEEHAKVYCDALLHLVNELSHGEITL